MNIRHTLIIIIIIFCYISCKKDTTGFNNEYYLSGTVTEENSGNPIADVNIHFTFLKNVYFRSELSIKISSLFSFAEVSLNQNYPNPFNPTTTISFALPVDGTVVLEIFSWPKYKLIKTLVNDTLFAGYYQVQWDGTDNQNHYVTNGIYTYRLSTPDTTIEKYMFLHMIDPEYIKNNNCIPVTTTDNEGNFSIDYEDLPPVGFSLPLTNETGDQIGMVAVSDTFNIILLKEGYINQIKSFRIDTHKNIHLNLKMIKQ